MNAISPSAEALRSGDRRMTQGELALVARKAASALARQGIGNGGSIALLLRNDFQYFILAEAGRYIGVGVTPINWHLTAPEIEYIVKDSGATALIAHADLFTPAVRGACADVAAFVEEAPGEIAAAYRIDPADCRLRDGDRSFTAMIAAASPVETQMGPPIAALFYTSGTTGRPKAVERGPIPPEAGAALANRSAFAFGLTGAPLRAVMTGPLYHSAPNAYALTVVRRGGSVSLQAKFDALQLLQMVERERITHLHMVPTMFQRMLALSEEERRRFDLTSLRHVVHGAAPCPPEIKQKMIDWLGEIIHEYYAMTELGIIARSSSQEWVNNRGSVGAAPPGVEIEIRRDNGAQCAVGEAGNICIRHEATHAFSYKNAGAKAEEMRQDGFVITGDVGYLNERGFLFISDRKTDMILSGGVNVYPAEIEAAITDIRGVRDCAVFGAPDPEFGETPIAVIEAGGGIDAEKVKAELAGKLAKFKTPRIVIFVDRLPREDSGKVKKRRLKDAYLKGELTRG